MKAWARGTAAMATRGLLWALVAFLVSGAGAREAGEPSTLPVDGGEATAHDDSVLEADAAYHRRLMRASEPVGGKPTRTSFLKTMIAHISENSGGREKAGQGKATRSEREPVHASVGALAQEGGPPAGPWDLDCPFGDLVQYWKAGEESEDVRRWKSPADRASEAHRYVTCTCVFVSMR